jgi:dCMP deaminase
MGVLLRLRAQKMYVTMFPCNECSKLLIQAGIKEIVFYEDKAAPVRDASPNEGNVVRSVAPPACQVPSACA